VFKETVAPFIKQQREAARQGKLDVLFAGEFKAVAHLRNLREVQAERENRLVAPMLLAARDARTPLDGWDACLDWLIHLDAASQAEQLAKHTKRMQKTFSEEVAEG
jgi:hypothetical protein